MEKVPTCICPLRSIGQPELTPCLESGSADGACALVSIADALDVIQRYEED